MPNEEMGPGSFDAWFQHRVACSGLETVRDVQALAIGNKELADLAV